VHKCRFFADGITKKQNIKKFLKGESEGETISKMFPSHGCGDMAGSQTALAECRRAWDRLRRPISPLKSRKKRGEVREDDHTAIQRAVMDRSLYFVFCRFISQIGRIE